MLNLTKSVAKKLRKDFLSVNFNLNDIFCDGNYLNDSCQNLPISNKILAFFYRLSTLIQKNCVQTTQNILILIETDTETEDNYSEEDTDRCDKDNTTSSCSASRGRF